jgi:hypothetical protein
MAGIFDRIRPGEDRLSAHLLKAAVYFRVRNVFTAQQILTKLNSTLMTPLDAAAQTDLVNVVSNAGTGAAAAKLDYLERWDACNIAAENGLLTNEATYRSELGI